MVGEPGISYTPAQVSGPSLGSLAMYCIKVELSDRKMSELVPADDNDYMEVFKEPLDQECVQFSVGNPRVEHITGIVHLYKRNTAPYGSHEPWKASAGPQEVEVSQALCCLAIPADMSVAHFCTFIGAYLGEVRSIQVLRREGSQPSVCMVLLTFASQDQADGFYGDFNGLPFSSLEPDILCRLVYVRDVEVLTTRGRPTPVSLPASAKALTAPTAAPTADASPSTAATTTAAAAQSKAGSAADATGTATAAAGASRSSLQDSGGQQAVDAAEAKRAQGSEASTSRSHHQAIQQQPQQKAQQGSAAVPSYAAAVGGQSSSAAADSGASSAGGSKVGSAAAGAAAGSTGGAAAVQSGPQGWLEPPPGTTELPTCPVCLERLDEHISGIVTTVCNHRFHGECIKHWGDTSCPVCRYCMLSSNTSTSRCSTCGTNTNLWICLICGHVGCGRYKQGHANDHWKASAHCYALELETQRVWDYAGDGYVHRLIQSKTDGKLVEVPSPAPTCPHGSPSLHHHHHHHRHHHRQRSHGDRTDALCRSRSGSSAAAAGACSSGAEADLEPCTSSSCPVCADENKQMKEALVSSKLEAISLEYNHLLATQLDSQRQYFEGLLAQQDAKQQAAVAAAKAAAEQAQVASEAAAAAAKDSDRRRQQLDRKLSDLNCSLSKVTEEREFLRSLNETLLSNQKDFHSKLATAQADLAAKDAQMQDLQEQVRDLMVFIEAQRTIQSAGGSELQDATLLPMPQSRTSRRSNKK